MNYKPTFIPATIARENRPMLDVFSRRAVRFTDRTLRRISPRIVREKSLRRKLTKVATSISNLASSEQKNSAELLELAETQVFASSAG